jgi:hypothetical protein
VQLPSPVPHPRPALQTPAYPAAPAPRLGGTFRAHRPWPTLEIGGERVELAWHGPNHSPDNIYIHFPDHDTLMFIDVVNAGWIPIYNLNLSDDVIGYTGAPAIALDYPWTHLISGHLGRVATREDVAMHQQYIADIEASSREALASVNPGPIFQHYGDNVWAADRAHLDAVTEHAAAPVIAKYTGVLGGADIEIFTTTFAIMQSIRLDRGPAARSIPDHNAPGRSCPGARPCVSAALADLDPVICWRRQSCARPRGCARAEPARSSNCCRCRHPRSLGYYLLSASTRRSISSSTLPVLGSPRLASWSLSSALVRPS